MKDDYIIKTIKDTTNKICSIEEKFSTIFTIKYKIDENPSIKNYNPKIDVPIFLRDDFKKSFEKNNAGIRKKKNIQEWSYKFHT